MQLDSVDNRNPRMETLFLKKVVSWGEQRTGKELTITKINSTERNKNQCANEATESLSCDHRRGKQGHYCSFCWNFVSLAKCPQTNGNPLFKTT